MNLSIQMSFAINSFLISILEKNPSLSSNFSSIGHKVVNIEREFYFLEKVMAFLCTRVLLLLQL